MTNSGRLHVTTPTDREIVMTRTFDAPRATVFDAMTKPELLRRWLFGPPGWSMVACEGELRVGGSFRWAWRGPDGAEMAMRGTYREVAAPERVVRTETFDFGCEAQAGEQVATLALAEQGGKTLLTITLVYPSKEARDAALASGMEQGVAAGYDRLDELLAAGTEGSTTGH
jgi:uncharacterized protein YndB with AHSA1/START domain